jgi:uncharacterized protein (DUF4415 family)
MKLQTRVTKAGRTKAGAEKTRAKSRTAARPKTLTLRASAEEPTSPYAAIDEILGLYKPRKKVVTLRLDADVLAWFQRHGRGYQTRINRALREVMREEVKESGSVASR